MLPDLISCPGPSHEDDMLDLLIEVLDGDDLRRTALVMRAVYLKMDRTRENEFDRLCEVGISPVFRI